MIRCRLLGESSLVSLDHVTYQMKWHVKLLPGRVASRADPLVPGGLRLSSIER